LLERKDGFELQKDKFGFWNAECGMWNMEYGMQITAVSVTVMAQSLPYWWANDDQVVTGVAVEEVFRGIEYEE
jgi:hypothetical protein